MKNLFLAILLVFTFVSVTDAEGTEWRESKSTHFIIYYQSKADDAFVRKLTSVAEGYYNRIAEDLGFNRFNFWLWDKRAKIYIYDDAASFQKATGQPGWAVGVSIPQDKVIRSFIGQKDFYDSVLAHEMSHIIFREFIGFDNPAIPLWLEEGVAGYQQKTKIAEGRAALRRALDKGIFMRLDKLNRITDLQKEDDFVVNLFYTESLGVVDYLISEFGRDKFVIFCRKLRDKRDFSQALNSAYHFKDIEALDAAWRANLAE
jgi:hypothetical protein